MTATRRPTVDVDFSDPATYSEGIPHAAFADVRATEGLLWNPMPAAGSGGDEREGSEAGEGSDAGDDGFWAVTRHADIVSISRDTATFSSAAGHIQLYTIDDDALDARASMIDMDPPMHTRLRRLVSSAFTPKHVQGYLASIRTRAARLLDDYVEVGGGDWVEAVSKPLPIGVICDLMGVPESDHNYMIELTDHLVEGTSSRPLDPDAYGNTTELRLLPFNSPAAHGVNEYARHLGDKRRANPTDDLVSRLVHAEVDGEQLTDAEFARFFQLMIFAGNETTRSTMSHLGVAMAVFGQQFDRLRTDAALLDSATEEILRWASAIMYFRRTAMVDTEVAGTRIAKGDKVVMWYASANFDEEAFTDPQEFDVGRQTVPAHVAFGGGGAHFCLGASLARLEIKVLIEEYLARRVELVGPVGGLKRVSSNFVHGLERAEFTVQKLGR